MECEGSSSSTRRSLRLKTKPAMIPVQDCDEAVNDNADPGHSTSKRQTRPRSLQKPKPTENAPQPDPRTSIISKPPSSTTIKLGAVFRNYDEFERVFNQFKQNYYHPFSCPSSQYNYILGVLPRRTVPDQKYAFRAFKCAFAGNSESVRTRGKGYRPNQTYLARGCTASFRLNLDYARDVLVITKCNLEHNHPLTPDMLDKKERKKYGMTLPGLPQRAVSEVRSFREDNQPISSYISELLEAQYRINTSHDFPAFRKDLARQEPIDTSRLLREGLPHSASPVTAQTSVAAYSAPFAGINIKAEPVDPEDGAYEHQEYPTCFYAPWPEKEVEAAAAAYRLQYDANTFNPFANVKTEPVEHYQDSGDYGNQENEQPWLDILDCYANEVAKYTPVNGSDEMQELVDAVRHIADGVTH
uniref:FAR1 domain-containing protein n=1 Tax=Panagrellus redivivus TaxID=6233 RepID=A0A7E4ZW33_PANRE